MADQAIRPGTYAEQTPRREPTAPNPAAANALAGLAGAGLAATVLLTLVTEHLDGRGAVLIAAGRLTGMVGAYALVVMVLLVARIPALERVAGQDRLVAWHRGLGPWPLCLVAAHGALIALGYAAQAHAGVPAELWGLIATYPGVLAASVAFVLLITAGVASYRRVRRRVAYETWWAVHLYMYIALFLAFSHQVDNGQAFVGHPAASAIWTAMWVAAAAVVLACRVALPLYRTLRHRPVVESVEADATGVTSIVIRGRALDRLPSRGGQFLHWRVLRRGLWWQAHPYSLSALPRGDRLRLTVKHQGDHSTALAQLRPGTRLAIEGPYGAFTAASRQGDSVLLVGAGVGVTPVRALLEDLPREVDAEILVRASTHEDMVLRDELRRLARGRGARLREAVGPREHVPLAPLLGSVPDLAGRDVFVCGPDGFTAAITEAAVSAGVARDRIHSERFEL